MLPAASLAVQLLLILSLFDQGPFGPSATGTVPSPKYLWTGQVKSGNENGNEETRQSHTGTGQWAEQETGSEGQI